MAIRFGLTRRRAALLAVVAVGLAVVVWSVVVALLAAGDLRTARADIRRITSGQTPDRSALEAALSRDLQRVHHAHNLLQQPGPVIFGWLPILGRNIAVERAVADAAQASLRAGLSLSRTTRDLGAPDGGVDVPRLDAAAAALHKASDQLRPALHRLATQPVGWTLPAVSDGMRQARDELLSLGPRVSRAAAGLDALHGVLGGGGRRNVVVILMNNAELRGAGGLPAAYATGTIDHGQFDLGSFEDVNRVARPPDSAQRVAAPADYHATYGPYLADSTLWKNTTMSPNDDETAQVIAAASAASLHVHPDVVVLCDVPAAAAIASATGPVTINGENVAGAELTRRLLVDAYGNGSLSRARQRERHRALDEAATQAFDRLSKNASSTPALLEAVANAVTGRHLVLWSDRPGEESQLVAAGAAGAVVPVSDLAMVTANNLGDSPATGNKLDYYVRRSLRVDVRLSAKRAQVTQTLVLKNIAPTGLGPYVEGVVHPGMVRELLTMSVGADATLTGFTKDGADADVSVSRGPEGQRATVVVDLARGATTTYRLTYDLPVRDERYSLTLVPQPLATPARLQVHITTSNAELGVVRGIQQPIDSAIDVDESWDAVHDITIPVHPLHGPRAWAHAFAHFWTHKV